MQMAHLRGRGGGTAHNGLYRKAPSERGIVFRLEVYKRVRFSWAAVEMDRENRHLGIKDGAY